MPSLVAFRLAWWTALGIRGETPDWAAAARLARDGLVPEVVALGARRTLERLSPSLEARGIAS